MSTRANIIIKEGEDQLFFYRHSDGYPEGVAPTINEFLKLLRSGKIRNNISQSAGWLIILGHDEYKDPNSGGTWKVGAYEPTLGIHGDIDYLYEIDLETKTVSGWEYDTGKKLAILDLHTVIDNNNNNKGE